MNWEAFFQNPAVRIIALLAALAGLIRFGFWLYERLKPETARTVGKHYSSGRGHFRSAQYRDAQRELVQAVRLDPNFALAHSLLGRTYSRLAEYEEAITCFTKALTLEPDREAALHNRGHAFLQLGKYRRAIKDFDRSLELNPDDPKTRRQRGLAHSKLGEHSQAIEDLNRAVSLAPFYLLAYTSRSVAHAARGDSESAQRDLARALQIGAEKAADYYGLAIAHASLGQVLDALASLKTALELDALHQKRAKTDPDFDNIRDDPRFRKLVYGEDERTASQRVRDYWQERVEQLRDYLSREPDDAEARYKLAEYNARLLENADALYNLERAIELDEGYRDKAKKSSGFRKLQRDLRFRKLIYGED